MSLRAKITLLAIGSSLLVVIIVSAFVIGFFKESRHDLHDHYRWLVRNIAHRIYANPSPEFIRDIAAENNLKLRYRGYVGEYVTDSSVPRFNQLSFIHRQRSHHGKIVLARAAGVPVLLHRYGKQRLMVLLRNEHTAWRAAPISISVLVIALAVLWIGFYFLQHKLLSPLGKLSRDMEAVGRGEWRESDIESRDDIGDLARVFNQMQRKLRRMVETKERFLVDASHELRSPLARLKLAIELIDDKNMRQKLSADVLALEALTSNILQKTRMENFADTLSCALHNITSLFDKLRPQYPKIDFQINCDGTIYADMRVLQRAFENLFDNAMKFSRHQVTVTGEKYSDHIIVQVRDDGPGVPEESLPHIFEPFYRVDQSRARTTGGFGLGLSIVRATIVAHGGDVSAHNANGLVVDVRLPLSRGRNL